MTLQLKVPATVPPKGATVRGRYSKRLGIVQTATNHLGLFSVAWRDGSGLWEVCGADDVLLVVEAATGTDAA